MACLDGDGVTNLVDVGLDLDAGAVFMVITIAVVAGEVRRRSGQRSARRCLENCGRSKTTGGSVQSVWVSSKRRKVGAFRGSGNPGSARIRRGFIHLDVDVLEVADVGDVRDRASPWKFSFFSWCIRAVARERRRQRKYFGYAVFVEQAEKCRSELERRSVRETAVRERAPRATRVVPPLNEAER